MPNSFALRATVFELRAVMIPDFKPARCSKVIPRPSCVLKLFCSSLSAVSHKRPSVSTPSQSIKSSLMREARRSRDSSSLMRNVSAKLKKPGNFPSLARQSLHTPHGSAFPLIHLKEFNPQQLPAAPRPRQNQHRGSRTLHSQFFGVNADVGRNEVGVQLFCSQHPGLPELRLSAHYPIYESHQLARHNARFNFGLLATKNRLIQLADESANGGVYR